MTFRPRVVVVVSALALAIACSGRQAATPTTPSSPAAASPAPAAGSATISGTVVGMSSASSSAWSVRGGAGMTVSVVGTSSSAMIDGNGRFTLINVPAGRIDLHFMGNGADAHLMLDGVASNQTLTISVRVSGSSASLDDDHDDRDGPNNEVELEGLVTSTSANTITVGGRQVNVTGSTQIVHGGTTVAFQSIHTGDRVHVKGTPAAASAPNGPINATKIEVQNPNGDGNDDNDERNEVELNGSIAIGSLAGSCAANSLSFKIGSTLVRSNAATQFKDTACTALKAGDSVEVKGVRQTDASVLASRIEREDR
jgi:hypothetical protein